MIVQYDPEHDFDQGWVYNRADIDRAAVVWAHDMGEERNRGLIDYFSDSRVWVVRPDEDSVELSAYKGD